ncbi:MULTISPECIES: hypothetical protein [Vibrio]|nr:hypothetical protein [Vibrio tasmaniensis]TKG32614.1 hypothetical protein FC057_12420 [Vibrio tasmaniensis]TKG41702.1 hypothetical protein FC063_07520 [Vibrio tasmaniensis]TKG52057.1 hypothetical protein FC070_09790 [Vibrio tasmaniensis]TKG54032.1 hypothetical protein FC060_00310 [Vibrio tasmaniensis]TKG54871.1 hypothetical protein FC061_06630 [Vibrio tasmaniensis]
MSIEPKKRCCQICEFEKSVGKYYLSKEESEHYGWWRVCSICAQMVSRLGSDVTYYRYSQEYKKELEVMKLPINVLACEHEWDKHSLVSEVEHKTDLMFDWMRCKRCNVYGKRFTLAQCEMDDLMMEIDINCSR